ncbi:hypothetical protein ABB37_05306 [Leptomonas pyrrhocoris]|uniref:Uncharacterized protein n=1 Tax=Leptomonas pyrrhocoris TaxID=157538 RepID=A0A0M9G018_LEPPY|nr:hypothetical protein ABB37_05306 [Leptomonas pyrrhocoris]KPA79473.1 hypothetical protein ABB37_05306 [Leptomonas pyrrhocoris]|eukprot:XP_015657912.1 hypothetical protein ABB37_05306 [Leptomonas pyrrhocoris]
MSEAVARAERELYAYITALQDVLRMTTEDAIPESLWEGDTAAFGGSSSEAQEEMPDTLLQRVERETELERHRINDLVRRRLVPQHAALCAAIVQLGGGQDAAGNVVDVPVDTLDREIAATAAESAALGKRMVELYDEAAVVATRIEAEVMGTAVPSL